jgi:hypothetical protein
MDEFDKRVEVSRGIARYESGSEVPVNIGYVAVVNSGEEPVWEKTVLDVFKHFPFPRPHFDKRLARAASKAQSIVDTLNAS